MAATFDQSVIQQTFTDQAQQRRGHSLHWSGRQRIKESQMCFSPKSARGVDSVYELLLLILLNY